MFFIPGCHAQFKTYKIPDSLNEKSLTYCKQRALSTQDTTLTLLFTQAWIEWAKWKVDWDELDEAYRKMLFLKPENLRLQYTDSILVVANNAKNKDLLAKAYLTKGIHFYQSKNFHKALDYYVQANSLFTDSKDEYNKYKVKYAIATIKYQLGLYKETLQILEECLDFYYEENERAYLNVLHVIGLCYRNISEFDMATYINNMGIQAGKDFENTEMELYFRLAEGINTWYKENFFEALNQLVPLIGAFELNKNIPALTNTYFYIGKTHWKNNDKHLAAACFEKVDANFMQHNYIHPELRENYELLIKYHKEKGNTKKLQYYIDQMLFVDSILNKEYKELFIKMYKEYDTPQLLAEKEKLAIKIKTNNRLLTMTSLALFTAFTIMWKKHKNTQEHYKKKFIEIMNRKAGENNTNITAQNEELNINKEIVDKILKKLEIFESSKRYLEKDMNLNKIARYLDTNTKYASKVIAKSKGKKTIDYITDLKIDHILFILKTEKKYRNYTTKALGESAGFGSTQNFTKAFKNQTGISPAYFVQELLKSERI